MTLKVLETAKILYKVPNILGFCESSAQILGLVGNVSTDFLSLYFTLLWSYIKSNLKVYSSCFVAKTVL